MRRRRREIIEEAVKSEGELERQRKDGRGRVNECRKKDGKVCSRERKR